MHQVQPSRTAQEVAIYRAAHQLLDDPRIFDDPFALPIVGKVTEMSLRSKQQRIDLEIRAIVAMRSRYAEDELARAVTEARGNTSYSARVSIRSRIEIFVLRLACVSSRSIIRQRKRGNSSGCATPKS